MMLGRMHEASFATDPKHLGFVMARYHFVARMFDGYDKVLEVGCGDCTGAHIVRQSVRKWTGIDKTPLDKDGIRHDVLTDPLKWRNNFDGIYALDVLEHIEPFMEKTFFQNVNHMLRYPGTVIVGTPSLESQPFASTISRSQHINCKTQNDLKMVLSHYYQNVFLFGMNDCTLHTGFGPMCHYRLAICVGKRL